MNLLLPASFVVFLLVVAGNRLWARRSLALLSVEQKARVLEASAAGNVWPIICLVLSIAALCGLPTAIPVDYRAGVLWTWAMVPFLISLGAAVSTVIRFSRLQLPPRYLRALRSRTIIFHFALLSLMSAVAYDLSNSVRRHRESQQSSNRAMPVRQAQDLVLVRS